MDSLGINAALCLVQTESLALNLEGYLGSRVRLVSTATLWMSSGLSPILIPVNLQPPMPQPDIQDFLSALGMYVRGASS